MPPHTTGSARDRLTRWRGARLSEPQATTHAGSRAGVAPASAAPASPPRDRRHPVHHPTPRPPPQPAPSSSAAAHRPRKSPSISDRSANGTRRSPQRSGCGLAELAPEMAERGSGAIVNVSTMAAELGIAGAALYGSSKAAVNLLTKSWAAEYGPRGVRVNAVQPGPTRTEGTAGMGTDLDTLAAQAPAGRPATPREIAEAIAYLAGDTASFVHGVVLPVDGGRTAV
ncbi:SDR family oxidoreductase [Streptomyces sp. NPDC047049]|uniref:SDR family NAD(P)-dependent oxidoreductase n=1 Tax=Streptomyces sp. NPDC047049 TaxID=3156688 RepID=UPI0033D6C996